VQAGASYVSFGAFFPSRSKPTTHRATTAVLDASATLGVPRVAIGGLTADNAAPVIDAGADLVAVIGGVYDAADPVAAACALRRLFG
jgi:thiamine-phosphate pyrophosphorylase